MMLGKGRQIKLRNGKKLGNIRTDRTFMTFRKEKKHLFRIYNGWALNRILLKELRDVGVEFVEVHATDTGYIYRTKLENFFTVGIYYKNPKNEKDEQIVLPLKYWAKYPMLNKRELKKIEKSLRKWLK